MTDTAGDAVEIVRPDPSLPYAAQPGLVLAVLTLLGEARGEKAAPEWKPSRRSS